MERRFEDDERRLREALRGQQMGGPVDGEDLDTVAATGGSTGLPEAPESVYRPNMTRERIQEAIQTLIKYKTGKAHLEERVRECEEWWRMREWRGTIKQGNPWEIHSHSAWLFNTIVTKHADAMDSYPEANILPREQTDEQEAKTLKDIIPVVLKQNDFKDTYSAVMFQKFKAGTGVYGVFWDGSKHGGLGDIAITNVSLLNIFWEPGVKDIQKSENLFVVEIVSDRQLKARYPQLRDIQAVKPLSVTEFVTEDTIDTTDKSLVVDWYYHTGGSGKPTLQLCKFVGDTVLYCSEDDPNIASVGLYEHGKYPFVFDPMYPMEGSPAASGLSTSVSPRRSLLICWKTPCSATP